jgi:hypothetical protein
MRVSFKKTRVGEAKNVCNYVRIDNLAPVYLTK